MNLFNYENLLTGVLFLPAVYMWKHLITTYFTTKKQNEEEELYQKRHNCVIMYSKNYMRGWPPNNVVQINTSNLEMFLEPYVYFIDSANYSIEIATMRLAIKQLFDALKRASLRGIKVRIITNFLTCKSLKEEYQDLVQHGIRVAFYVDKTGQLNHIMHCKYMVKDYDRNKNMGNLCMGSMNFAGLTSILNNYENVTFTSNIDVVGSFHKNFEESWEMIERDNKNKYNKSVLSEFGFS